MKIKKGDLVFLYREDKPGYLVKVEERNFNTDRGIINLGDLEGEDFGQEIKTHLGFSFYILKPFLEDIIMKGLTRFTQIIYPKDASLIIMKSGIKPGDRVIEVGTGSGSFTIILGYFLGPRGKVYSYEKRKEFYVKVKKNIEKAGKLKNIILKNKEIKERFDERGVDFVMLDMPIPWELIDATYKALKPGRRCCAILPTINQTERFVFTLREKGFINIETIEVWVRKILVRKGKTRPQELMPSHTGYLSFATKIISPSKS